MCKSRSDSGTLHVYRGSRWHHTDNNERYRHCFINTDRRDTAYQHPHTLLVNTFAPCIPVKIRMVFLASIINPGQLCPRRITYLPNSCPYAVKCPGSPSADAPWPAAVRWRSLMWRWSIHSCYCHIWKVGHSWRFYIYTEIDMSFLVNFPRWLHRKLTKW